MSKAIVGPEETWPPHQKPYWRKPLDEARAAGWSLHYDDAPHKFGEVWCPAGEDNFLVDKTSRGAEHHALLALQSVRRCRHGKPADPAAVRRKRVVQLLKDAESLLDTVDEEIGLAWRHQEALAHLDQVAQMLETAELSSSTDAVPDQSAALEAVIDSEGSPNSGVIGEHLDDAGEALKSAEAAIGRPRTDWAREAASRAGLLRGRETELRDRLGGL